MIEKELYIEQSRVFEVEAKWNHVCKLKKAFYGLKQAPRAWYGRIDSFLMSMGFAKSKVNPNLSYKVVENVPVILLLYVDEKQIMESKKKLAEEFEMKELGSGSMEKFKRNLSQVGKVCSRDIEEIQYVGMQSHGHHTHGLQLEAVR